MGLWEIRPSETSIILCFIKKYPSPLSRQTIDDVLDVHAIPHSIERSLYNQLRTVYQPFFEQPNTFLSQNQSVLMNETESTVKSIAQNLETALDSSLNIDSVTRNETDEKDLTGISTVYDEHAYWKNEAENSRSSRASAFEAALAPISSLFTTLGKVTLQEEDESNHPFGNTFRPGSHRMEELVDSIDSLWNVSKKPAYPRVRMVHLLGNASKELIQSCSDFIKSAAGCDTPNQSDRLFSVPFSQIHTQCDISVNALNEWSQGVKTLTQASWLANPEHKWSKDAFTNTDGKIFLSHLESFVEMRMTVIQIITILSANSLSDFEHDNEQDPQTNLSKLPTQLSSILNTIFQPFSTFDIFSTSQMAIKQWDDSYDNYSQRLQPLEIEVSNKLKSLLNENAKDTMTQNAAILSKANLLLRRPNVSSRLMNARETMLGRLQEDEDIIRTQLLEIQKRQHEMKTGTALDGPGGQVPVDILDEDLVGKNLPPAVNHITKTRALLQRTQETINLTQSLFGRGAFSTEGISAAEQDLLTKAVDLQDDLQELKESIDSHITSSFKLWEESITGGKTSPQSEEFKLHGRLVKIGEADGLVRVEYNERLVALLREVRHFTSLGFTIPQGILKIANIANTVYCHAVQLKQIATFYNSISTQVIPSQKMMLADVVDTFDSIVTDPFVQSDGARRGGREEVTWSNETQLEVYMKRLKTAADAVSERNNYLRLQHQRMTKLATALLSLPLTKRYDQWKGNIKQMNGIIVALERAHLNPKMWKAHWNHQLYKIFFLRFQADLPTLIDEDTFRMGVSLDFDKQRMQCVFTPSLHIIRTKLYSTIQSFVGSSSEVGEMIESPALFDPICSLSSAAIGNQYQIAEKMLFDMDILLSKYARMVNIDPSLTSPSDSQTAIQKTSSEWEETIANIKQITGKLRRAPTVERISGIEVSTSPLVMSMESLTTSLIMSTLKQIKTTVLKSCETISEFSSKSTETLTLEAKTMTELNKALNDVDSITVEAKKVHKSFNDTKQLVVLFLNNHPTSSARDEVERRDVVSLSTDPHVDSLLGPEFKATMKLWKDLSALVANRKATLSKQTVSITKLIKAECDAFKIRAADFVKEWENSKTHLDLRDETSIKSVTLLCERFTQQADELRAKFETLKEECLLAKLPPPEGTEQLEEPLQTIKQMEESLVIHAKYNAELAKMKEQQWVLFRSKLMEFEDFNNRWREAMEEMPMNEDGSSPPARSFLVGQNELFGDLPAILRLIRGEEFTEEHWASLFTLLEIRKVGVNELTFGHLIDRGFDLKMKAGQIRALQRRAQGEVDIRKGMDEIMNWGTNTEFTLGDHTCTAGGEERKTPLVEDWADILSGLDDKMAQLSAMKESQFFSPFADTAITWEKRFAVLGIVSRQLSAVQRRWVYLEPIFVRGAIPAHQARFKGVDEKFRAIMNQLKAAPQLPTLFNMNQIEQISDDMKKELDKCQQALSEFLEEKRDRFPRFYFIGDDDLLEILGQAQNPSVIQAHLKKLFQGIHRVVFSEGKTQRILSMCSSAGEVVDLVTPVDVIESVEDWLNVLTKEMRMTLSTLLQKAIPRAGRDGKVIDTPEHCLEYIKAYPSQVLNLAETISFTSECEDAITSENVKHTLDWCKKRLVAFSGLASQLTAAGHLTDEEAKTKDPKRSPFKLTQSEHTLLDLKIKSLIFDIIHNIDVCEQLIQAKTKVLSDWTWFKQMRYYVKDSRSIKNSPNVVLAGLPLRVAVCMADSSFEQTFEYQGNAPRLVHTPLTDKCYLVLTQAMRLGYGGHPYGPAGTGKTESVKALGMVFGRQVLVFNCDEGIDAKGMGRIFRGIVKCGAWGCFDEFNRLEPNVLSAISEQIQAIQKALKDRVEEIELLGSTVKVDTNSGIFVTMNPAGKGYGGRSKLPDNLTQLFRSVAMSVPNNDQISDVILSSEGFTDGKNLASKLVSVFQLAKDQLSKQIHYDWGLRSLKIILNTAGILLKRELAAVSSSGKETSGPLISTEREAELVIQALRSNTLSKLTFTDAERFNSLIQDVFPHAKPAIFSNEEMEQAIRRAMTEMGLGCIQSQIDKIIQLHVATTQRMGIVLVGGSGCGKSTLWKVLQKACVYLGQPLHVHTMNPKALPRSQLLGHLDLDTRKWHDGILTSRARMISREPDNVMSWLICDGDIDPEWIESLNSVLDDNRLLTLPSGERIQFQPSAKVNFIFETDSLRFASPATVSRMAVIFLSDEDLGVGELTSAWIRKQKEEDRTDLQTWMNDIALPSIQFVLSSVGLSSQTSSNNVKGATGDESYALVMETTLTGIVRNMLSHLSNAKSRNDFGLGVLRGLGSNCTEPLQRALVEFILPLMKLQTPYPPPNHPLGLELSKGGKTLESYRDNCRVPAFEELLAAEQGELMLQTDEVATLQSLFRPWITNSNHFLLVGPEGAGKHMLLSDTVKSLPGVELAQINCSSQTSANQVAHSIKQHCLVLSSAHGRTLRPKRGDRIILFLSDLHLPQPDKYGTVEVVAFIQQILTYGGFFDSDLEWTALENIQIIATIVADTTGASTGVSILPSRFTANVCVCAIPYPSSTSLLKVYTNILECVLADRKHKDFSSENLAQAMIAVFTTTQATFNTSTHIHYCFTPRDLTRLIIFLARCDVDSNSVLRFLKDNTDEEGSVPNYSGDSDSLGILVSWAHECFRLFKDRLDNKRILDGSSGKASLSTKDSATGLIQTSEQLKPRALQDFEQIFSTILKEHFGKLSFSSLLLSIVNDRLTSHPDSKQDPSLRLVSWYNGPPNSAVHKRLAIGISNGDLSKKHALKVVQQYERTVRDVNVVLFSEFIDNLAHMDRLLSWPGSSLLLIGKTGVGRRTIVQLVCNSHNIKVCVPVAGSWYDAKHIKAFMRSVIESCVVVDEAVCLYLDDSTINSGATGALLLDYATALIQSQDVHGFYSSDEFEVLRESLKESLETEESSGVKLLVSKGKESTSSGIVKLQNSFIKQSYRNMDGDVEKLVVSRIRRNLHVVLSMDPSASTFDPTLRSHPALYTRANVMWFGDWSHASCVRVTKQILSPIVKAIKSHDTQKSVSSKKNAKSTPSGIATLPIPTQQTIINLALAMHFRFSLNIHCNDYSQIGGMESNTASPRDLIRLLQVSIGIYDERMAARRGAFNHLSAGVEKLKEANDQVDALSKEAKEQSVEVERSQKECSDIMVQIEQKVANVSKQRTEAAQLEENLKKQTVEVEKQTKAIQKELSEVQPLIEEALKAVDKINPKDINELKGMNKPPDAVAHILGAVLTLMGEATSDWGVMKRFLAQTGSIQRIASFDPKSIKKLTRDKTKAAIEKNQNSFKPEVAAHASKAVAPLALWVKACIQYAGVYESVAPLEEKAKKNNELSQEMKVRLADCRKALESFEVEHKKLQTDFDVKKRAAAKLEIRLQKVQDKRDAAQSLLGQLSEEQSRWIIQIEEMNSEMIRVPLQSLLSSGYQVYLSGATEDERRASVLEWVQDYKDLNGIKATTNWKTDMSEFSYSHFMSTEAERLGWKQQGLPGDDLSLENGAMIVATAKSQKAAELEAAESDSGEKPIVPFAIPFIIDPTAQITNWLRATLSAKKESSNEKSREGSIDVVQQNDPKFLQRLELAVRWGKILIVEEVDSIEPVLYPLLRKEFIKQGNRLTVAIGDKLIDLDDKFALFLVTRNPHPNLPPDARGIVSQISFSVTRAGLEAQLLSLTIQHEQPTIEQQRSELLQKEEGLRLELAALEKQLLDRLANSQKNILEDTALIESLNETKAKSNGINDALIKSSKLQDELNTKRNGYRPLSVLGGSLFFLLHSLSGMNHMYQYSLGSFLLMFSRAHRDTPKTDKIEVRIANLGRTLVDMVIETITRGMFKSDRLAFGLHLAHTLNPTAFGDGEWDHFLGRFTRKAVPASSVPKWIGGESTGNVAQLMGTIPNLESIAGWKLKDSERTWRDWIVSQKCEVDFPLPAAPPLASPITGKKPKSDSAPTLTLFQRVLLIQACRPDRLMSACLVFVKAALGISSIDPPPFSLNDVARKEAVPSIPILLIITPGIDPSQDLEDIAKRTIGESKYTAVAMGQGQGDVAIEAVKSGAENGSWVCLKNVHLMPAWLGDLEKTLALLKSNAHPEFRVFLTSEAHDQFNDVLVQQSLKITYEAPPGIKKNLARTFDSWKGDGRFERGTGDSSAIVGRSRILFALAWLHGIVQERRTYIPQGWIRAYEFSSADLRSAVDIIDNQLDAAVKANKGKTPPIPWETLRGLLAFTVYGGRIDSPTDWRVLEAYLQKWISPSLLENESFDGFAAELRKESIPLQTRTVNPYITTVQKLPEEDSPSFFSLPSNIDGTVQNLQSQEMIGSLKRLSFRGGSGTGGYDREEWRKGLMPIIMMWNVLLGGSESSQKTQKSVLSLIKSPLLQPHPATLKQQGADFPPIDLYFLVESTFGTKLLEQLHRDLRDLEKLLCGEIGFDARLEKLGNTLLIDEVPAHWDALWDGGSESASEFIRSAVERTNVVYAMTSTITKAKVKIESPYHGLLYGKAKSKTIEAGFPSVLKNPIPLGKLFRPAMLLNALRQQTARNLGCAMDELELGSCVNATDAPKGWKEGGCVSCNVSEMRLQGGMWKNNTVCEAVSSTPSASLLDVPITLAWIPVDVSDSQVLELFIPSSFQTKATNQAKKINEMIHSFPVFLNERRERMLMHLQLPVEKMKSKSESVEEKWILSGACLFV
ncbi:putative Cytoplasmic dynein 2 heavy chain 1 [Blattamonas nauphoetae]|uniref:Cytoplasmic dynein 2 heavy chain 1 n=1 Tax=Blattamonas nauphoetae TaxID=2049346 RepID=A0ABQ9XMQ0_9EUKA|nr:putative Cytoplasmic dynein 2 heavy chain 1 [Blattamonas nauphoetae]